MSVFGNVLATAVGVLRLDSSQVDQGVNQAGQSLSKLTDISRQSYFGLRNLGLGFEAVGDAALGVVAASTAAATSWEAGNARIEASSLGSKAAVDAQGQAVAQFKLQLEGIADSTPVPIKSIQSVGDEVAKLGVGLNSIAPDTKEIIDLNQLTGTSYDTLTQGVGKATLSLGLGSDGIKRFGSTLFDLQREAPATTEDILTLTNRIAGIGPAAHISEPGILAIATSVASVGGNARTNASAIQKFIEDIVTALNTGGGAAQQFAQLAGFQSAQQFSQAWAKDPVDALGKVLTGLGQLDNAQGQSQAILQSLGLTQATQVDSLLKVAQAQTSAAGGAISMANANQLANQSWQDGNSVQNATSLIYGTTSARLAELKNQVQLTAVNFGAVFLPELRAVSGLMTNVAAGFEALPGPLQAIGGGVLVVGGGIAALAGFLLLLLPRILLARQALEQLTSSSGKAAVAHEEEAAAAEQAAEGETLLSSAARMTVDALMAIAGTTPEVVAGEEEVAAGAESAGISIGLMTGGISVLLGVLTLGVVGLDQFGSAHRRAAQEALNNQQANEGLLGALQQEKDGIKGATDQWILHQLAINNTLPILQSFGFNTQQILELVKGTADTSVVDHLAERMKMLGIVHKDVAQQVFDALNGIIGTYQSTATAENALTKADKDNTDAAGANASTTDLQGNKLETLAQKQQKAAQAAASYGQDVLSQAQAQLSLKDAEDKLQQAADDLANKSLLLADAQEKVALANSNAQKAAVDLTDAQFDLDNAQQEQAIHLVQANDSMRSAELAHEQAIQGVKDAQQRLNEAMDPSQGVQKLRDAFNELRDAQESVHQSQQGVADAQWQLNYLMGEGASSRDILEARDALEEANNKAQDAAAKVTDAQDKLNKAQDSTAAANAQADAQLALQSAQLQVQTTETQLEQQQINLNKAQQDAANNKDVIDAQAALEQAHGQIISAQIEQYKSTEALHEIQNGSIERAYAAAQNGVESAIYQVATSAAQTTRDLAEMRGETFTDAQYAAELSRQLTLLGNNASGPVATQINNIAGTIGGAAGKAGGLAGAISGVNDQGDRLVGNSAATQAALEAATPTQHHTSWWHALSTEIGKAADAIGNFFGNIGKGILNLPTDLAKNVTNFFAGAEGAILTKPTLLLAGEAGPEVLLPLNNPSRMQELLGTAQATGLLPTTATSTVPPSLMPVSAASVSSPVQQTNYQYGNFEPTIISNADPDDMMREWEWRHRVKSRSA